MFVAQLPIPRRSALHTAPSSFVLPSFFCMIAATVHAYRVFGIRLVSTIDFPELQERRTPSPPPGESGECEPVVIRWGRVPSPKRSRPTGGLRLENEPGPERGSYFVTPQRLVFEFPEIGRLDARGGRELVVWPDPQTELQTLRSYILGIGLAAVLQQQGRLVLHASGVAVDQNAVLFVGEKGAGKSTLTAALNARDFPFITDDIAPIRLPGPDSSDGIRQAHVVDPGFLQQKLWPDAAQHLGRSATTLPRLHSSVEKRLDRVNGRTETRALPVQTLYVLVYPDESDPEIRITPIRGIRAFQEIVRHSFLPTTMLRQIDPKTHFEACEALLQTASVYRLQRPRDLSKLQQVIERVVRHQLDIQREA